MDDLTRSLSAGCDRCGFTMILSCATLNVRITVFEKVSMSKLARRKGLNNTAPDTRASRILSAIPEAKPDVAAVHRSVDPPNFLNSGPR